MRGGEVGKVRRNEGLGSKENVGRRRSGNKRRRNEKDLTGGKVEGVRRNQSLICKENKRK